MGVVVGEWIFPDGGAPALDAVASALNVQTGLVVDCTHDADGNLEHLDLPLIKESLFDWQRQPDRIHVRSFIPAHRYLWVRLNSVMTDFGGRISDNTVAWRPNPSSSVFNRPWAELSGRQRFILRLPSIVALRPLDFLAERDD